MELVFISKKVLFILNKVSLTLKKVLHFNISNDYQKESIIVNRKFYSFKRKYFNKKVLNLENESSILARNFHNQ